MRISISAESKKALRTEWHVSKYANTPPKHSLASSSWLILQDKPAAPYQFDQQADHDSEIVDMLIGHIKFATVKRCEMVK